MKASCPAAIAAPRASAVIFSDSGLQTFSGLATILAMATEMARQASTRISSEATKE